MISDVRASYLFVFLVTGLFLMICLSVFLFCIYSFGPLACLLCGIYHFGIQMIYMIIIFVAVLVVVGDSNIAVVVVIDLIIVELS